MKLNKTAHPAGTRFLVSERSTIREYQVLEWSDSGKAWRRQRQVGATDVCEWTTDTPEVLDTVTSPPDGCCPALPDSYDVILTTDPCTLEAPPAPEDEEDF